MTPEEIEATLALEPKEAAAIIKEQFLLPNRFYRRVQGDTYFFLVDPTFRFPATVADWLGLIVASHVAREALKELLISFAQAMMGNSSWGVVRYALKGPFLNLTVEPGYLERGGRIRRGVDPRSIPRLLALLRLTKDNLQQEVKGLVDEVSRLRWWIDNGLMEERRKQDWSPRGD